MKSLVHAECILVRGIKTFKCIKCGKISSNYSNGVNLCDGCCKENNQCKICGKQLGDM